MFASSSLAVFVFAACVTRGFFYYFTNVDPLFKRLEPPVVLVGRVVSGFGRGSKELGIPTANLDPEALGSALDGVTPGVYCGWAAVDGSVPYKTVMSIGLYVCMLDYRVCTLIGAVSLRFPTHTAIHSIKEPK